MRVAVTGASGFIGGHIVRRLADDGHDVVALGRRAAPDTLAADVEYAAWDLAVAGPPPAVMRGCDAVVHVAAHVADWGPRSTFRAVTVDGTARVLDAVGPVARVICIGTASVYDPTRPHPGAHEAEAPVTRYLNDYGWAKAGQERLVAARRPDALILRPHAVYGPGDRTLLPRLIAARRRGRLLLPAGGRHVMSVTHVDTLADAVLVGLRERSLGGPMNVADATPVAPAALLADVFDALGLPTRIVAVPIPVARVAAVAAETGWRVLRRTSPPPLTRYAVSHLSGPFVLDLTRLHTEGGIRPDRRYRDALASIAGDLAAGAAPAGAGYDGARTAPKWRNGRRDGLKHR